MTHAQWNAKIKRSLALAGRNPEGALRSLRKLAQAVESQGRTSVHDWHLAQTLHIMSIVQSGTGDHHASANTILRVAAQHEQELLYQQRAFVSACAAAALQLAQAGNRSGAARMLRKAASRAGMLRPKDKLLEQAKKAVLAMPRRGKTTL